MARCYWSRKAVVEESCGLKMPYLRKRGLLSGQATGWITWTSSMTGKETAAFLEVNVTDDPHIRIAYSLTERKGNKADFDCEASLVTTDCNFGGVRYWFGCPDCGERVGVLYLAPRDVRFRCRYCDNLSYRSRNCSGMELLGITFRQVEKLRSEIKRWSYKGKPTKKVQKLHTLQRKVGVVSSQAVAHLNRLKARIGGT
jgi:hypothetical protein